MKHIVSTAVALALAGALGHSLMGRSAPPPASPEEGPAAAFFDELGAASSDSARAVDVIYSDSRPPLTMQAHWLLEAYYLPEMGLSAAFGISVKWDPLFRLVTLAGRKGEAKAVLGGPAAVIGGRALNIPRPLLEDAGRLMIPVSFIELALPSVSGVSVSWDEESGELRASAEEPSVTGVTFGGRPGLARITVSTRRPLAYRVIEDEGQLRLAVKGAVPGSSFSVQGGTMSPLRGHEVQWSGDELMLTLSIGPQARAFQTFRERFPQAIVMLVSSEPYREGFDLEPLAGSYRRWGRIETIVLDPAHGGDDWGATGPNEIKEKDVVLQICKKAASILEARLRVSVYLTRDSDYRVPAAGRAETANSQNADLFVSVHCDAWPGGTRGGYGAYVLPPPVMEGGYWSPETSRSASPGRADLGGGFVLRPWSRLQGSYGNESRKLANALLKETGVVHTGPGHGVIEMPVVSLVGVDAPAVSMSLGFLNNRRDLGILADGDGRDRLAAALARGVEEYIGR